MKNHTTNKIYKLHSGKKILKGFSGVEFKKFGKTHGPFHPMAAHTPKGRT